MKMKKIGPRRGARAIVYYVDPPLHLILMNLNKMDNLQPNNSFTFPFILINKLLCLLKFLAWLKCLQYLTNKLQKLNHHLALYPLFSRKKKKFLKCPRGTYSSELSEIFNHSKKLESIPVAYVSPACQTYVLQWPCHQMSVPVGGGGGFFK